MPDTDINEKYVIYYAVRGYRTGQTVTINIYDTVGTKEIDSDSMTELGTTGVHSFNFFPRKRTSYAVIMDCIEHPQQSHQIIRVEKQKISGAITFPKIVTAFTPKVKDEITNKLLKLTKLQEQSDTNIKSSETLINKTILELSQEIRNLSSNTHTFSSNVDNARRQNVELMNENIKEINKTNNHAILSSFQTLQETFLKEINILSKSKINSQLKFLTENIIKLVSITDETNANLNISNDLFSSNIKDKINSIANQTDEVLLLMKNAKGKN